ncbi:hypothetical protein ACFQY7_10250 [Actinomadura luteofluorescens]|uniref:hypothetical protein n=1 Tax=Actinomadura luteofluorescens TaxID=46163 RepID=UPI00362B72C7
MELDYAPGALRVSVRDNGPGPGHGSGAPGRARAARHARACRRRRRRPAHRPGARRGFLVEATLPLEEGP